MLLFMLYLAILITNSKTLSSNLVLIIVYYYIKEPLKEYVFQKGKVVGLTEKGTQGQGEAAAKKNDVNH